MGLRNNFYTCWTFVGTTATMSLYRYFQRQGILPTARDTGLTSHTTAEANKCVEKVVSGTGQSATRKRKYTTTFTGEDRAKIGRYADENGN